MKFAEQFHPDEIPDGVLDQPLPPAPDIVYVAPNRRVGIEISQIVPRSFGRLPDTEIEAAQRKAVQVAQRSFVGFYGNGVFANFSFTPGILPPQRQIVKEMVELVAQHRPLNGGAFSALAGSRAAKKLLPSWLSGLSIFPQLQDEPDPWFGSSVWSTSVLREDQIAERIKEKSSRLPGYREFADEVWLMLVCDEASIAACISIPREASSWRFEHPFDRVLLVSRQEVHRF